MKKSLLLFIHGLDGSSTQSWGKFPDLIRADDELRARFDVALDDYPTRKFGRLFERVGGLDLAAEGLKSRIENIHGSYDDIAIIAHSQGGLIALRYILDRLLATEPLPITRIVTFATPYHGATSVGVGSFLGGISEQAEDLAPESNFLFRLNRDWMLFRDQHSVQIKAVVAGCDGVVGAASASGLGISYYVASACNHETIVKPTAVNDESFVIAKRFLLRAPINSLRQSTRIVRALKLPDEARIALRAGWEQLEIKRLTGTNSWQDEWNAARDRFELAFATAAEDGQIESWRRTIDAGQELREIIRKTTESDLDIPLYYIALVSYTDAVERALKAAISTPGNIIPREQDDLIQRIEKLEVEIEEERVTLRSGLRSPETPQAMQELIEQLTQRLDVVEAELGESKNKAYEAEKINILDVDSSAVLALVREGMEALRRGIDLLNYNQFSTKLQKGAKATWLAARRYLRSLNHRYAVLTLPWRREAIFHEIENNELNFPFEAELPSRYNLDLDACPSQILNIYLANIYDSLAKRDIPRSLYFLHDIAKKYLPDALHEVAILVTRQKGLSAITPDNRETHSQKELGIAGVGLDIIDTISFISKEINKHGELINKFEQARVRNELRDFFGYDSEKKEQSVIDVPVVPIEGAFDP